MTYNKYLTLDQCQYNILYYFHLLDLSEIQEKCVDFITNYFSVYENHDFEVVKTIQKFY